MNDSTVIISKEWLLKIFTLEDLSEYINTHSNKVLLDLEVLLYCKILKKLDDNEDVLITKGELARLQIRDNWSKEYIKRKEEERKFSCSVQMVGFD